MAQFERGELSSISQKQLMQVADALPISVEEYGYLFRLLRTQRTFHAYNVGIMRTGTGSMAALFSRYRTRHEYVRFKAPQDSFGRVLDYQQHRLSRPQLLKL